MRPKKTMGSMNRVAAAAMGPHGTEPLSPMMEWMRTGMVTASVLVRVSAKAYSFQDEISEKAAVAATPGTTWGSTTRRTAWNREWPSSMAASSKACGISAKKAFIIEVVKERLKQVYSRIRPKRVSRMPMRLYMKLMGTARARGGSMRVESTRNKASRPPRNGKRLKP